MNADRLLAHYEKISDAPHAIPRLRRFILNLAVRGKLVRQNPNDEPASELLKRIAAEKARLVKAGKIRKESVLPLVATYEALFSVPNVWEWTRVGSTAYVEMGQSPPSEHYNRTGHGIPFFQGKADFGKRYPTARYWCTQPKKYAGPGDIMISVRAPVGPTNVASEPCCIGRGLAALRPHNGIDRNYLLRCLEAFEHVLAALGFGTTFVAINKNQLTTFVIPLPPLAEQHRIVAKVDELMALCDRLETARTERETTRDRLTAASLARLDAPDPDPAVFQNHAAFALDNFIPLTTRPDQVKALRQTILNLAVRGKLVEQDPNDEPASELLKRIAAEKSRLTDVLSSRGRRSDGRERTEAFEFTLPRGWTLSTLGSVALKITDGAHQTPTYVGSGVPFVSVKDFSAGRLDLSNTRFITENEHSLLCKRCDPKRGDILIGRIGTLGRAVLVDTDDEFSLFVSVGLIRFSHENIAPRFLRTLLNSPLVEGEFDRIKIGGGTHTNKLNLGDLQTVALPIPPLAEQHRIVAKVDELMALCNQLKASLAIGDDTRCRLLDAMLHETLEPVKV